MVVVLNVVVLDFIFEGWWFYVVPTVLVAALDVLVVVLVVSVMSAIGSYGSAVVLEDMGANYHMYIVL